jgi:hypothetical protein
MTPHNARGQGRKPIPEEERLVLGSIRLSPAQWRLFRGLGGAKWLRAQMDAAIVKIGENTKNSLHE